MWAETERIFHLCPKGFRKLLFWEIRVGLHFEDLLGMTRAVRRDKQNPLVGIEFLSQRIVNSVSSQVVVAAQEVLGLRPALNKLLQ